jgi:hypothetical protein
MLAHSSGSAVRPVTLGQMAVALQPAERNAFTGLERDGPVWVRARCGCEGRSVGGSTPPRRLDQPWPGVLPPVRSPPRIRQAGAIVSATTAGLISAYHGARSQLPGMEVS